MDVRRRNPSPWRLSCVKQPCAAMADSQRAVTLYMMRGCPHGVRRPTRRHGAASVTATATAVLALLVTASLCLRAVPGDTLSIDDAE